MATLGKIKRRIESVKSTQQITKAMKMVAAAKLRKAQEQLAATRPYTHELFNVIGKLAAQPIAHDHPCFVKKTTTHICYVLVTADRGLCGSFNTHLINQAEKTLMTREADKVSLLTIGKMGYNHFRRQADASVVGKYVDFFQKLSFEHAVKIADALISAFEKNRFDSIVVIHNDFQSIARQQITVAPFLPIEPIHATATTPVTTVFEPHPLKMLDKLLRTSLHYDMYRILLESFTAEQSARMTAMETASDNAEEMIKTLVLYYNKARQAAITTELNEIVGGAEALKG